MGFLSAFQQQTPQIHHQAPEKFSCIVLKYLESLDALGETADEDRAVTIIARSPSSAVIRAIIGHSRYLAGRKVTVRVLLARFTPTPLMGGLVGALGELSSEEPVHEQVRWLRHPRLLDAHEQVVMGTEFSWTGDSLRRSEDRRNTLDMFSPNDTGAALLGIRAFAALWRVSATAPLVTISDEPLLQVSVEPPAASGANLMRTGKELHAALLTELTDFKGSTRH
jgi:hypothetical protein